MLTMLTMLTGFIMSGRKTNACRRAEPHLAGWMAKCHISFTTFDIHSNTRIESRIGGFGPFILTSSRSGTLLSPRKRNLAVMSRANRRPFAAHDSRCFS